ncbi:hypothetical protein [Andreprevotia chitinilytica]|uniref:hypothetical protein n=1 Tax=Andreprevotia chitinilytica TaxID=396808 RepID=UPI000551EA41|nr:hypothetical protein [Andreprevotia chitinilytica]
MKQTMLKAASSLLILGGGLMCAQFAAATDTDIVSADVKTCNIKGSVTITIAGVNYLDDLGCANPTDEPAPGENKNSAVNTTTVGVTALSNVAGVTAPFGDAKYDNSVANKTILTGTAGESGLSLVQGLVQSTDVAGQVTCTAVSGSSTLNCTAATTLGTTTVNGSPISIPAQPIPLNYTIALTGLNVGINLAGIPVTVPVSGSLILNELVVTGLNTHNVTIAHNPVHLILSGSANALGSGLVGVSINVIDATATKAEFALFLATIVGESVGLQFKPE